MALIVVGSAKGSPGATTLALTLTAVWPRPALMVELDPSGSDLRYRLRDVDRNSVPADTGVLGLIVDETARTVEQMDKHCAAMGLGVALLAGPPPTRLAEAAGQLGAVAERLAGAASRDVLADCGRFDPGLPQREVLLRADTVVLVTRPTIDGVAHLLARATEIADVLPPGVRLHAVVVTDARDSRSPKEIDSLAAQAGVPIAVLGRFAHEATAVGLLSGAWSGRLDKTLLIRSARELATKLNRGLVGSRG